MERNSSLAMEALVTRVPLGRKQRTVNSSVVCSGVGVHTGHQVTARFFPAEENSGIRFRRADLPGKPEIPALIPNVQETPRCTIIGVGEARVHTVEHVLAAIRGCGIDNLLVELSHDEPPIMDGSSAPFVKLLEEAGIKEQGEEAEGYRVNQPIHWSQGEVHLVALPHEGFKVSFTLHHPEAEALRYQYLSLDVTRESFQEQLSACRTFCFHQDIAALQKQGLIKGGSLDNAVVFKGEEVISHEGLRFQDEPVRHKILDLVGDLFLLGRPLHAHVIAIRSGHAGNVAFAKEIYQTLSAEDKQ